MPRTNFRSGRIAALPAAAAAALLLTTAGHVAAQDRPTLTSPQASSAVAGRTLTVTGEGFTPDTLLFVTVCDTKEPPGRACDMGDFAQATTDASGRLKTSFTANAVFGSTDCATTVCAVMTNDPAHSRDVRNVATVPLKFAGKSSSASTPGTSPTPRSDAQGQKSDSVSSGMSGAVIAGIAAALAAAVTVVILARRSRTR